MLRSHNPTLHKGKATSPLCKTHAKHGPDRYTQVQEVQIRPNPKKAASVEVQVQAEGEKVRVVWQAARSPSSR